MTSPFGAAAAKRGQPGTDPWLETVCAGSEMGQRVLEFDWAATPLGPPQTWPEALRTAVGVCLTSRFPLLVVWGPDLRKIYNDAYVSMLGSEKHPAALGAPVREVWPEIWDIIGPLFESVITTRRPTWQEHQQLVINRNGYLEECYFTYSYSPLFEPDGSVGGVLDVATETTEQILARRRLACLAELSSALLDAGQVTDVCARATASLAGCSPDVPGAEVYLRTGASFPLVSSNRREDIAMMDPEVLRQVSESGVPLVLGDDEGLRPAEHVVTPIGSGGDGARGLLVTTLNPQRPFDSSYRLFIELLAGTIGSALEGAYRRAVEVGEYRWISDTLQQAMLKPSSDLPTVAARYVPAVGNLSVGGDWYDVIDVTEDCRAVVVGDCVGHGLQAAMAMAQLRTATRAMLLEGRDPAATLEGLDRFARSTDNAFCATAVIALIDRPGRTITYSRAGHPPPLIIGTAGLTWLDGEAGVPLAVDPPAHRRNTTWDMHAEDVVVLYSDGLIERRDETIDAGLDRLAEAVTALQGSTVHEMADELLRRLLPHDARDDVVLVVKQLLE